MIVRVAAGITALFALAAVGCSAPSASIVAIGDSITRGVGASDGNAYPDQLAHLVHAEDVNLGIPGAKTAEIAARELDMIPGNPDVVVVCTGTNDVIGVAKPDGVSPSEAASQVRDAERDLVPLLDGVRAHAPNAKIVLVSVRDLGRAAANLPDCVCERATLTAAAHEWNRALASLAKQRAFTYVDLEHNAQWYVRSDYDQYGIHPNDAGAARLAKAVAAAIGPAPAGNHP